MSDYWSAEYKQQILDELADAEERVEIERAHVANLKADNERLRGIRDKAEALVRCLIDNEADTPTSIHTGLAFVELQFALAPDPEEVE